MNLNLLKVQTLKLGMAILEGKPANALPIMATYAKTMQELVLLMMQKEMRLLHQSLTMQLALMKKPANGQFQNNLYRV